MKERKRFRKRVISLLLICAMVITQFYSPVTALAEENNTTIQKSSINEKTRSMVTGSSLRSASGSSIFIDAITPAETSNKSTNDGYEVTFKVTSQWVNAFQGNIEIKNVSDQPIKNWSFTFDMGHEITNIWNAVISSHSDNTYKIIHTGYNKDIAPGQSISIGYQASYTNSIKMPEIFELNFMQQEVELHKEYVFNAEGYDVIFKITNQWDGAFNGEFIIKNNGEKALDNWAIRFDFDHELSNIWNAVINEHTGNSYIIKNVGSNQDVMPGSSISFGFEAKGEGCITLPRNFDLLINEEDVASSDYAINFKVTSDWGNAFNGEISITNNTDTTIEDWFLEFDFDHQIERFWTAVIEKQEGNHYVVKNSGYNANIKPGETITLGFSGNPGDVKVQPKNFVLRQIVSEPSVELVELPDGKIDKNYLYRAIYPRLLMDGLSVEDIKLADDFDGDGLTLAQEYEYDTNPFLTDTDEDGLDDYQEIFIYKTDPNYWDTDRDEMSDGTEVSCGLNPLKADTDEDGILDSYETIQQQVRLDSLHTYEISEVGTLPSVVLIGTGDYSRKLQAISIENDKNILDINCLVGTPFEFIHDEDLAFESGELTFSISNELLTKNRLSDLSIAWYNHDENALELLDTTYNSENQTISANVSHFSTYMVVSEPTFLYDIDWMNKSSVLTAGKADVIFVVDTTGSMTSAIQNVRNNISLFVSELKEKKVDIRLGLVEYRDIYADGTGTTKSYDWYTDVASFRTKLGSLGIGGGGDTPESAVDALHCAENMSFRSGVNKYIILITDANYKDGIVGNASFTMQDEIDNLVEKNIVTSVVTGDYYQYAYNNLVNSTDGVIGNIYQNFVTALRPLINKMGDQVNSGCWVRLANGLVVKLDKDPSLGDETIDSDGDGIPDIIELNRECKVEIRDPLTNKKQLIDAWSYYSNPAKKDTDEDGINDIDDLNPAIYDTTIVVDNDKYIKFNTGRIWYKITCTSYDYIDNVMQFIDWKVDNPIPLDELGKIVEHVELNKKQNFSVDELTVIGLCNNEGSKLYMDNVSAATREIVFTRLENRQSDDYQHVGILWWESWEKVPKGTKGGFFKGAALSEADINFSTKIFYICDIYSVLNSVAKAGATVIAVIVLIEVTPVVVANLQGIIYYVKTFGITEGFKMYLYLGVSTLPSSVITWIQWDIADGDSSLDDMIGANIPIHQRGITGEEALQAAHPGGITHKYFPINDATFNGGRYMDLVTDRIAYESKVGYTCLSSRIKTQILKDAWLLRNDLVDEVYWEFYRSAITGKVGASQAVIDLLKANGITPIIHK